ncbi:MAG: ABC transporter ATP-binding protein [Roseomonas sp.]|nr:ABC transporter ATP-binding protein [Roseomonas sp.]
MQGLSIKSISRHFGAVRALDNVSLDVAAGEFVALVGPSGCGKSTLMRIVAGIETADAGSLSIGSRDVTALRAAERNVAMVFQNYALYPHLTVSENIAVPLAMRRLSAVERLPVFGRLMPGFAQKRAAIAIDVLKAAQSLGLDALLDRKPGQLSGGQRQRVALARAIVRHPDAFLMDEPLSNLDAALRVQTRREIVEIHRRVGAATLYVTHDQSEALTMADRVAVMQAGQILQVSSPEAIYHDPQDIRVATFIGSPQINIISAQADAAGHIHIAGKPSGLHAAPGPVTIAIRPENLRLAGNGLPCVAEGFEFLGEGLLLHARHAASNEALVVRLPPEIPRPHAGETIHLTFEAKHALLFDRNGKRVALRDHPAHSEEFTLA